MIVFVADACFLFLLPINMGVKTSDYSMQDGLPKAIPWYETLRKTATIHAPANHYASHL